MFMNNLKKKMKNFIYLLGILFMFSSSSTAQKINKKGELVEQKTEANKPNILFIITDDQQYNTINALGNNEIITPNLDKLVTQGTTFLNAYNMGSWTGAVCVASRGMIISGLSVWDTEKNNAKLKKDSTAQANTWLVLMKNSGYKTYMTGKWHVKVPAKKVFDVVVNERPGMPKDSWSMKAMRPYFNDLKKLDSPERNSLLPVGYGRPLDENDTTWSPSNKKFGGFWEGGIHWSEVIKNDAIDFLDDSKNSKEPFFMYLAFNAPHDPRQSPQEFIDMYPVESIKVPENFVVEYPDNEAMANGRSQRGENLAPFPRTEYAIKKHIQEYYAAITHLDEQVGHILEKLETSGQNENTIIVFTSDHGLAMGQHGMFSKSTLFEHSVKAPLIISGTNIPKGKKVNSRVYIQDIVPTILEMTNTKVPDYMFFKSLKNSVLGEASTHHQMIYGGMKKHQRSIIKDNYKLYILVKIKKIMLFNLEEDPLEMNDLGSNPEYRDRVKSLFQALIELQKEVNDELDLSKIKLSK